MKIRLRKLSILLLSALIGLSISACPSSDSSTSPSGSHTVSGTITMPQGGHDGTDYIVGVFTDWDSAPTFFDEGTIVGAGITVNYSISNVPTGTYYVMAIVYVNGSGRPAPVAGDYFGLSGWNRLGDPEASIPNPNVSVSADKTVDFTLIECGCDP